MLNYEKFKVNIIIKKNIKSKFLKISKKIKLKKKNIETSITL